MSLLFEQTRTKVAIWLSLFGISFGCLFIGIYGVKGAIKTISRFAPIHLVAGLVEFVQIWILYRIDLNIIEKIYGEIELKNQNEQIVRNLEESVVIICDNKWQMTNQSFLKIFRHVILKSKQVV